MDVREDILARLVVLAGTLVPPDNVFRNQVHLPETRLPAIVILDGDEDTDEDAFGRGRPPNGPLIMEMRPEIYLQLDANSDTVGTHVNVLRAAIIKAFLTDSTLVALCHNGDIRYAGSMTAFADGRSMEGKAQINIAYRYVLRPDKL